MTQYPRNTGVKTLTKINPDGSEEVVTNAAGTATVSVAVPAKVNPMAPKPSTTSPSEFNKLARSR